MDALLVCARQTVHSTFRSTCALSKGVEAHQLDINSGAERMTMMSRHRQALIKFPYEIKSVEPALNAELLQYFKGERTGFVQVGPEKYFFPHKYQQEAEHYYNFQARADDIWVVTFPRSGTTWTQELVWLVANNLNFKEAKSRLLTKRFPFFEFPLFVHPQIKAELLLENADDSTKLKFIENISRPGYEALAEVDTNCRRFIKSHFPFSLLPPSVMEQKCKIIYVARNPKDVAISFYHLNRLFRTQGYTGDFERYWQYFEQGLNPWLPYYSHLKEALAHRHLPHVLFLSYEDMLADLRGTINQVAQFLNCELSAQGVEDLLKHLNISNFRNNTSVNGHEFEATGVLNRGEARFVRNGGQGKPKELVERPELLERVNRWIRENEMKIFD